MRRRDFLYTGGVGAVLGLWSGGCGGSPRMPGDPGGVDAGGPDGAGSCIRTEINPEGPYYSPGAPQRSVLVAADTPGTRLMVAGRIVSEAGCAALAGATFDVWQADADGAYDNQGFGLRGFMITDAEGRFELVTIVPGNYLDGSRYRPAHLHVKASAPDHQALTTQLYFAGDPYNGGDALFRESLLLHPEPEDDGSLHARFDVVLARA